MNLNTKRFGLILASLIALSFNSHFAQAARKTTQALRPARAWAFKRINEHEYVKLQQVDPEAVVVKKTGVRIDRRNIYIGGYIINTTDDVIEHVLVYPTFVDNRLNDSHLARVLKHEEVSLAPNETRRFVIMRPVSETRELVAHNIPLEQNCILNAREVRHAPPQ